MAPELLRQAPANPEPPRLDAFEAAPCSGRQQSLDPLYTRPMQNQPAPQLAPMKASDANHDLLEAALHGDEASLGAALGRGAKPNARNSYGDSAASFAVENNHAGCLALLIDTGADIHGRDDEE